MAGQKQRSHDSDSVLIGSTQRDRPSPHALDTMRGGTVCAWEPDSNSLSNNNSEQFIDTETRTILNL